MGRLWGAHSPKTGPGYSVEPEAQKEKRINSQQTLRSHPCSPLFVQKGKPVCISGSVLCMTHSLIQDWGTAGLSFSSGEKDT